MKTTNTTMSKIIRESLLITVGASLISTIGGVGAESIRERFVFVLPLLVILPALNDMIGDFGTIVAQKFTTHLYMGRLAEQGWRRSKLLKKLFGLLISVAAFSAIYLSVFSTVIALIKGWTWAPIEFGKIVLMAIAATLSLVTIIFLVSVAGGFFVYKRGHDPDNYLIPIATSLADMGNLLLLSAMLFLLF